MIKKVGSHADSQAAAILSKCGEEIIEHFKQCQCNAKQISKRSTIERDREIEVRLWPRGTRKPASLRWLSGATFDDDKGVPVLWIWIWACGRNGQGERQAGEGLAKLLGEKRIKVRGADMAGWSKGAVMFGEIPLKKEVGNTFDVEQDELLKKVRGFLKTIRKEDVDEMFKI